VIFLDVEMPVMGGIEAAREIRALQAQRGEPPSVIAAFSAHDDEATRRECIAAGFDLYLAKPASREEVFAVLRGQDPGQVAPAPAEDCRVWIEPGLMPLMPEFLASRRQLAEELAEAAREGEREAIRLAAHKLAGSLAMYGFKDASRASRVLEEVAATEDLVALQARCGALAQMLAQAQPTARPAG
jgi:CheY-like chemotaxis protein